MVYIARHENCGWLMVSCSKTVYDADNILPLKYTTYLKKLIRRWIQMLTHKYLSKYMYAELYFVFMCIRICVHSQVQLFFILFF